MCWADTQVHPIEAEDSAIGLVKYASGAIGQFEVSWAFRGGMDLRDEISGTKGTIWLNHWMRTGFELFSAEGETDYVAEKAESETGWLFPVGDEIGSLGYVAMFDDMLDSIDHGKQPMESFYDGYVVNAIMDAAYRSAESKKWEPVILEDWRGSDDAETEVKMAEYDEDHFLIKQEKMPDGKTKYILKQKSSGKIVQKVM
jgi:predicted dehydrogenase